MLSGCFGTGTTDGEGDADSSGTTVINNYYNNTTMSNGTQVSPSWYVSGTTYHQCTPNTALNWPSNSSNQPPCVDDDETLADVWVMVKNYTVINQAPNTGIRVNSFSAGIAINRIGTICSNGAITGWGLDADNGERYDNSDSRTYGEGFLLPFAGLDCNHYLFGMVTYQGNQTIHWHVSYDVENLLPGPH